jgi:hypothetical protein
VTGGFRNIPRFKPDPFLFEGEKMRKKYLAAAVLTGLLPLFLGSCPNPEGADLPFNAPRPDKIGVGGFVVRSLCYVDVEKYNPLNAMDYTLEQTGIQFFDYVVLGAAQLKQDARGLYLYRPDGLHHVLEQANTFIVPLQKKGIKVLLGISGGGDGISFGTIREDDIGDFNRQLMDIIQHYRLDGVEFCDTGGAKSSKPGEFPYPEGDIFEDDQWKHVDLYPNDPERKAAAWEQGGDKMNNIIFKFRQLLGDYQNRPVIVREENYARYLPVEVSAADFTARNDQINFFVNPRFTQFGSNPARAGESANSNVDHLLYGPLAVNLDGDPATKSVVPPIEDPSGKDILSFSKSFAMNGSCDYGLIFYYNLKSVSQAAAEDYLVPPSRPGTKLTQAEYISITSQEVFREKVICSGGDYQKTW